METSGDGLSEWKSDFLQPLHQECRVAASSSYSSNNQLLKSEPQADRNVFF